VVSHAGEEGPPSYIWEALEIIKAERIDHGVRCVEDPLLLEHLVREKIPLTCCPFSNVKLCVFKTLEEVNLKKLLDLGVKVTINSDDPAYFMGYCSDNFEGCVEALGLCREEVVSIARNSIEGSFLDEAKRGRFLENLLEFDKTFKR
jgi:adenine deaminase